MENNLKKLLKILLLSPTEHDCYETRRVLTMSNMDENILLQIFLDRTDRQIEVMKETYQKREKYHFLMIEENVSSSFSKRFSGRNS